MSRSTTLYPAVADTCAIPCPITPEPKTVIFLIFNTPYSEIPFISSFKFYTLWVYLERTKKVMKLNAKNVV